MLPRHLAELETRLARRVDEALADYRRSVERRLRDAVERLASAAEELPSPALPDLLDGLELGALDLGSRRDAAREALGELIAGARELDGARTQAEALEALLDRATAWADRVALLLVRDSEVTLWAERGFGARGFDDRALAEQAESRERLLARRGCLALDADEAAAVTAPLGIDAGGAAVVVPLVLRDRIAALLWADRSETAPELAALQILVATGAQRLELQALSDRLHTPTLWEESEAPGEPLELWGVAAAAAAAAEPVAAAAIETEIAVGPAPVAAAEEPLEEPPGAEPELAAEREAAAEPEPAVWPPPVEVPVEPQAAVEEAPPVAAAEPAASEPAVDERAEEVAAPAAEPERAPEPEEEVEPLPEFEFASEPEPPVTTSPPPAGGPETEPPIDALGTVRLERPEILAPERPFDETTKPFEVRPAAADVVTHEIERPGATAPPADEIDVTEDATVLTSPRTEAPAPPKPAVPIAEPSAPAPPAPPPRDEDPHDRTWGRAGRSTQVLPPADLEGPGLAFVAGRASRALSDSPAHEEAKRLARLLISEIKLYNEEQVLEGRRNRDLYHRLREDIDRSRQIFDERVDAAVRGEIDYFQQELVRSLAGGDPRALGI